MFKDKKITIWGAGLCGEGIANNLIELGYNVDVFVDINPQNVGLRINGKEVVSPKCFKDKYFDYTDVIIIGIDDLDLCNQVKAELKAIKKGCSKTFLDSFEARNALAKEYLNNRIYGDSTKWNIDFSIYLKEWLNSIDSEVAFWKRVIAGDNNHKESYWKRLHNESFSGFDESVKSIEKLLSDGDIVVDFGCGVLTSYGESFQNGKLNIIAMDPLAAFYNELNRKYLEDKNFDFKKCRFGLFEFVDSFLPDNYVKCILINNALDHCVEPYRSIVKCLKVLKVGGILRLVHRRAEGFFEGWTGLHKWNIDYNNKGDFVLWNRENEINVSEKLKEVADIKVSHPREYKDPTNCMVTVEITKKTEIVEDIICYKEEREELAVLLDVLMKKYATLYLN